MTAAKNKVSIGEDKDLVCGLYCVSGIFPAERWRRVGNEQLFWKKLHTWANILTHLNKYILTPPATCSQQLPVLR